MKKQPGLRDFSFGWSQSPGILNVVSWWNSFADVQRFAGPEVQRGVVLPNEAHMVERMEIEHYQALPRQVS